MPPKRHRSRRRMPVRLECPCCCCSFQALDAVKCFNGHSFCSDCVKSSIESLIGSGTLDGRNGILKCLDPGANCQATVGLQSIQLALSSLDARLLRAWEDGITHEMICKQELVRDPDFRVCPFCRLYSAWVSHDDIVGGPNPNQFQCQEPRCHLASCVSCKGAYHGGPCSLVDAPRDDDGPKNVSYVIQKELTQSRIRLCPTPLCGLEFVREDGCNHMRCVRCMAYSCYLCKKETSAGYDHFDSKSHGVVSSTSNKCPLYTDERDVEMQSVVEAMTQSISIIGPKSQAECDSFKEIFLQSLLMSSSSSIERHVADTLQRELDKQMTRPFARARSWIVYWWRDFLDSPIV